MSILGDEDDREVNVRGGELSLEIKAASSGQPDIEHQAGGHVRPAGLDEFIHQSEQLRHGFESPRRRLYSSEPGVAANARRPRRGRDRRAQGAPAQPRGRTGSNRGGFRNERHVEKKYLKKDGTPVWLNITTTLVPGTETAVPFLQSVYMDITERVRFEAALRASE
jgi:hypothetical protein